MEDAGCLVSGRCLCYEVAELWYGSWYTMVEAIRKHIV